LEVLAALIGHRGISELFDFLFGPCVCLYCNGICAGAVISWDGLGLDWEARANGEPVMGRKAYIITKISTRFTAPRSIPGLMGSEIGI
jgi:hypothetical protein